MKPKLGSIALLFICVSASAQEVVVTGDENTLNSALEEAPDTTMSIDILERGGSTTQVSFPKLLIDPSASKPIAEQARDIALISQTLPAEPFNINTEANAIDLINLGSEVSRLILDLDRSCQNTGLDDYCAARDRLTSLQSVLENSAPQISACSLAANSIYKIWQSDRDTWFQTAEAEEWQESCLARIADSVGRHSLSQTDNVQSAVGVLFFHQKPVCSGLLTPTGLFVTARHCARDGGLTVRQSSSNEVRKLRRVDKNTALGTPNDWAIFRLEGGPPLNVASFDFAKIGGETAAYPVGLSLVALDDEIPVADVGRVLRTTRDGTCRILYEIEGCVHLACQTMQGFSGAPVFMTPSQGVDKTPKILGILSGGRPTEKCGMHTVDRVTFAVPIANVKWSEVGE